MGRGGNKFMFDGIRIAARGSGIIDFIKRNIGEISPNGKTKCVLRIKFANAVVLRVLRNYSFANPLKYGIIIL